VKKSTITTLLIFFLAIPLTLYLGAKLPGRGYYVTGTLIICEMMIPFFMAFEGRKPQARELVIIAVMCAIAVVSRVAIPLPQFKPIFAIIMIAGIAFGPEVGFIVGAISAFVSNFFVGQGPYTPWQMMAYGAGGMAAGIFSQKNWISRKPLELAFFGFFLSLLWVGPLLDCSTIFITLSEITLSGVLTVFGSGVVMNLLQSICTFLTMWLFSSLLLENLERVKTKYGML